MGSTKLLAAILKGGSPGLATLTFPPALTEWETRIDELGLLGRSPPRPYLSASLEPGPQREMTVRQMKRMSGEREDGLKSFPTQAM